MKILLWNCNNGISKQTQIDYFESFECDLAVIPELKKHNIEKLNPSSKNFAVLQSTIIFFKI